METLPRLSQQVPGTGGVIKHKPEDFQVFELPDWSPTGDGHHLVLKIRKRGLTTHAAVAQIAKVAKVPERSLGYAGIKDARAVTEQWVSVPAECADRLDDASLAPLEVLERARHRSKLKPGQLRGNRFEILVRNVGRDALERARRTLEILGRRGTPNAFGPQRFGTKGDSDAIGRAFVNGDLEGALRHFLGAPSELERDARIKGAREHFEAGRWDASLDSFPRSMHNERRVLEALLRHRDPLRALATLPKSIRLLFVSAYQSRLFNRVLAARLETLDARLDGDVLVDHRSGISRRSLDVERDTAAIARFQSSPSGPLFGPGLLRASGEAGAIEDAVFAAEGLHPWTETTSFRDLHLRGERRPLRFPIREPSVEETIHGLVLRFELPPGCYATSVLAEVMKLDPSETDGES